eukprot:2578075-Amphidinium_carterae.1
MNRSLVTLQCGCALVISRNITVRSHGLPSLRLVIAWLIRNRNASYGGVDENISDGSDNVLLCFVSFTTRRDLTL